jgi:hypothetical protein
VFLWKIGVLIVVVFDEVLTPGFEGVKNVAVCVVDLFLVIGDDMKG